MKEYKVKILSVKDVSLRAKRTADSFESILNDTVSEGWTLHDWKFRGKDILFVIFERDRS